MHGGGGTGGRPIGGFGAGVIARPNAGAIINQFLGGLTGLGLAACFVQDDARRCCVKSIEVAQDRTEKSFTKVEHYIGRGKPPPWFGTIGEWNGRIPVGSGYADGGFDNHFAYVYGFDTIIQLTDESKAKDCKVSRRYDNHTLILEGARPLPAPEPAKNDPPSVIDAAGSRIFIYDTPGYIQNVAGVRVDSFKADFDFTMTIEDLGKKMEREATFKYRFTLLLDAAGLKGSVTEGLKDIPRCRT